MVRVNKKYLKEKLKREAWGILLAGSKTATSPDEIEKVLARWLTPDEITMLEKRLAIKILLQKGVRHNEIKRTLDISSHTITSFKKRMR